MENKETSSSVSMLLSLDATRAALPVFLHPLLLGLKVRVRVRVNEFTANRVSLVAVGNLFGR